MHARYACSIQGRFTSADTVAGSIGNPQTLNRYAYVTNNPLNLSDPTGHMPSYHQYSSFNGSDDGNGWSWDDPNSPDAVLRDYTALPARIENEISQQAHEEEARVWGPVYEAWQNLLDSMDSDNVTASAAITDVAEPQNSRDLTDGQAASIVASGVEAGLQVLKKGCYDDSWNQDVKLGSRYFADVKNADSYTKGWSSSLSVHDTGVKESATLLTHTISVVDKNGKPSPLPTLLLNAAGAFNFVLKYYPGQGMAITSNTLSTPHLACNATPRT